MAASDAVPIIFGAAIGAGGAVAAQITASIFTSRSERTRQQREREIRKNERLFALKQETYGSFTFLAHLFLNHQEHATLSHEPELSDLNELSKLVGLMQLYAPEEVWLSARLCEGAIEIMWNFWAKSSPCPEEVTNHAVDTFVNTNKAMRTDLLG